jgi:DNA-binding beta-propeller fold protein YncE
MKKIASTVVLALAAATGAGLAATQPALAGARPAAAAMTGVSAPRAATRAPQLVRALAPGKSRLAATSGAQLWARRYNGPGNGEATSVAVSPGGTTVYVTGYSAGATSGNDYATIAYDAATGATRWVQRYSSSGGASQASAAAVSPTTGAVFVTGYSTGVTSGEDYLTIAYSGHRRAR